ncbi:MAG: radical SAM family heme chaperone HemW [Candidatus Syntrophosphaera sp.]|nr:radical SAM family heme chaperone HemW [Candidatus Syntrophosphaera sp.]
MEQDLPPGPLAVYLHIPFCLSRCGYCSFFSVPFSRGALSVYLRNLHHEIDLFTERDPSLLQAKTLYFGGGTPSLLGAEELNSLSARFQLVPGAEVTLEVNPLQITADYLRQLNETPVNRLSIGVQSLDDQELEYLGRRHRAAQIPDKIRLCREHGYPNISLDLIYGLPGSSVASLRRNLHQFITLEPEHLSCYLLTLEEDSPLGLKLSAGETQPLPEDDVLAAQYDALRQELRDAGFEQYEISNFCRPGKASRHNLAYWKSEPYLGLGASASGWLPPWRYANPSSLEEYSRVLAEGEIMPQAEFCGPERTRADYLMMGLRLREGIDLNAYQERFGADLFAERRPQIDKLLALHMLESSPSRLWLSERALFVSNAVIGGLL